MAVSTSLTFNDNAVLNQVFDPESAPTVGTLVDAQLPADPHVTDATTLGWIKSKEKEIILKVEKAMPSTTNREMNDDVLNEAWIELSQLIEQYPDCASLHANRAQVFRIQHGNDAFVTTAENINERLDSKASQVLLDLDTAIELLNPVMPQAALSAMQCRTLSQSYMQRGALYHAAAKIMIATPGARVTVTSIAHWTALDFQEAASKDFFMAGRYGNDIGKALAAHTNSTAKLCGQMVQEAMRREYGSNVQS